MRYYTLLFILLPLLSHGQKILTQKSNVVFFSDAALEDITATTTKATGIIDLTKGEFAFSVPIKDFEFDKSLMREHFNEKYMETEKYPKATFTGKIADFDKEAESQNVKATGKLSIHGVTREVTIPAKMTKTKTGYQVNAKFMVKLADHKIEIPTLVFHNIAEEVEVTADFTFGPQ